MINLIRPNHFIFIFRARPEPVVRLLIRSVVRIDKYVKRIGGGGGGGD